MTRTNHKITRQDCDAVITYLCDALRESGLSYEVDFIVYGSYVKTWKDGLSDLDGMLYFFSTFPPLSPTRSEILKFQNMIAHLYEEMPFLESGKYLYDLFILDALHGADGRFVMFDEVFVQCLRGDGSWRLVHGTPFLDRLRPVSLRNQDEFELALCLHKLRNYLLFEIPRSPATMSVPHASAMVKFFKVLPLDVTRILHRPVTRDVSALEQLFGHINYGPLRELWDKTMDHDSYAAYIRGWHETGGTKFIDCLHCFELTLAELVRGFQMKSRYQ